MENKNTNTQVVPVHWFKSITEDGKLATKGFVEIEDFRRIVDEIKPASIKNVIFNPPATIVLWNDGTKTVVKAENEVFDKEKGLAMAICKRTNGNNGRYFEAFKKYCTRYENSAPSIYSEFESMRNQRDNLLLYLQHVCSNNKELLSDLLSTFDGCPGFIYEESESMKEETTTEKD